MGEDFEIDYKQVLGGRGVVITVRREDHTLQALVVVDANGIALLPIHGSALLTSAGPLAAYITTIEAVGERASQEEAVRKLTQFMNSMRGVELGDDADVGAAVSEFLSSRFDQRID